MSEYGSAPVYIRVQVRECSDDACECVSERDVEYLCEFECECVYLMAFSYLSVLTLLPCRADYLWR